MQNNESTLTQMHEKWKNKMLEKIKKNKKEMQLCLRWNHFKPAALELEWNRTATTNTS
jgi:hypothetical protein